MRQKVVVMLDGGFVKKKLRSSGGHFPTTKDVVGLCDSIMKRDRLSRSELLRIYFYDCPPLAGKSAPNPIDRSIIRFDATSAASQNQALLDALELEDDFAVRRGQLLQTGWKLGSAAMKALRRSPGRALTANDFVPDITQKGVDIRIGLDIATIALKDLADVLILVTGDSDFVPAMKLARKEGMKVYLEALGHSVRRELKVHADLVL